MVGVDLTRQQLIDMMLTRAAMAGVKITPLRIIGNDELLRAWVRTVETAIHNRKHPNDQRSIPD